MKTFTLRILPIVLILIGIGYGIRHLTIPVAQVQKVSTGEAIDAVPAVVKVREAFTVDISSEIAGRILESNMEEGKSVKKGLLLIRIDSHDVETKIREVKNKLQALQKRIDLGSPKRFALQNKQDDLKTLRRQYGVGTVSKKQYERQKQSLQKLKESLERENIANAEQKEALLIQRDNLQHQLKQTRVKAPHNGTITQVHAWPGELVSTGNSLAALISDRVIVEARINEENFEGIKKGQRATVRFTSYGNHTFKGRITKVLPTADPETQEYRVHLDMKDMDKPLIPGLSGEASIIKDKNPEALLIPRRSLRGQYVFIAQNNTARLQKVQVGFKGLNQVEIKKGLEAGDLVITEELERFRDGDTIRIKRPDA